MTHKNARLYDAAQCRREDPELFFPVGETGPALVQIAEAKQVCAACPIRAECLADAMATERPGYRFGVIGGTDWHERDEIARRAALAARSRNRASRSGRVLEPAV